MANQADLYRAYLRVMAPDITDEDIVRLATFRPQLTPIALAVRVALRFWRG